MRFALLALILLLQACSPGGNTSGDVFSWPSGDISFPDGGSDAGPSSCSNDEDCPADKPRCAVSGFCFECTADAHCTEGVCNEGYCLPPSCTPGEKRCADTTVALICNSAGDGWQSTTCGGGSKCVDGECSGCTPGSTICQGLVVSTCSADGSDYVPGETCPQGCANGACSDCPLGDKRCTDAGLVEQCLPNGQWQVVEDCNAQGANCTAGFCISACNPDPKFVSNSGCDYWAIDLDNHPDAQDSPFAIVVTNLGDEATDVRVYEKDSASTNSELVMTRTVAPGALQILELPPRNMGGPGLFYTGYRVQSDSPIVAYQFNPLDNVDVFSNDASLLIPAIAFGTEYIVMSRFQLTGGGPEIPAGVSCSAICSQYDGGVCISEGLQEVCVYPYRGTITVVAKDPDTTVTVRPTAQTQAGGGLQTMMPGQQYEYTLQPFQVLNIRSDADGADLTGTQITANKPVGVFSGHMAAVTSTECCADHLEQMMFPVKTWGKQYVATKSYPRVAEKDYWRIVAAEDDTVLQFLPAVTVNQALNRGQYFEFSTDQDFVVTSEKPFLMAQILASSYEVPAPAPCTENFDCALDEFCATTGQCLRYCATTSDTSCGEGSTCTCVPGGGLCYCAPTGDPAMILAAPVEQFRTDYVFLTPDKYQDDYINVIAPSTASVTLDGTTLIGSLYTSIPTTGYKVARIKVNDGVHTISATEPVGVIVYGYDRDVSYGYPAGLNLSDQSD